MQSRNSTQRLFCREAAAGLPQGQHPGHLPRTAGALSCICRHRCFIFFCASISDTLPKVSEKSKGGYFSGLKTLHNFCIQRSGSDCLHVKPCQLDKCVYRDPLPTDSGGPVLGLRASSRRQLSGRVSLPAGSWGEGTLMLWIGSWA